MQSEDLKREAKNQARRVEERTRSELTARKSQAAEAVEAVARALRSTASELESENRTNVAHYTQQAATGLDRLADGLKEKSLDGLVRDSESFARRQPAVFFGAAMTAGFALARFLKSSTPSPDREDWDEPGVPHATSLADVSSTRTTTPSRPSTEVGAGLGYRAPEAGEEGESPWSK